MAAIAAATDYGNQIGLDDAEQKLRAEALDRLQDCKNEKNQVRQDIEECYFFAAPRRRRSARSSATQGSDKPSDKYELQTSLGMEVAEDFSEMVIDTFTPPQVPWAERKVTGKVTAEEKNQLDEKLKEVDGNIFDLIRGSNYYAEKGKAATPDASIGVFAFLITDPGAAEPIRVLAVPIREVEFNVGPDGRIDDRFICRPTKYRYVRTLLGKDVTFPDEIEKKIKDKGSEPCEVIWGWWRLWNERGDETWQHVVFVDQTMVHSPTIKGEGSCPFVIGRFGATPDYAWPDGPLMKALPELRYMDEIRAGMIEYIDFTLKSPVAYEDDGVINLEAGVEPGRAYPKRPNGGRNIFEKIYEPSSIEAVIFDQQQLRATIRRILYVDFPEQQGKTPPTATQWLDEMVLKQRRIGTPGFAYWSEEPYETFQRFRYLGEKRGVIEPIDLPAGTRVQPYNPAQRAQENQEVLTATRLIQIGSSAFQQTWQVAVDELGTLNNLKNKLGDKIVVFRQSSDLKSAVELVSQLGGIGGGQPGGIVGSISRE